jgi:hypothetical protein
MKELKILPNFLFLYIVRVFTNWEMLFLFIVMTRISMIEIPMIEIPMIEIQMIEIQMIEIQMIEIPMIEIPHFRYSNLGYAPALPTNIRPSWKNLPGTNTLVHYKNLLITNYEFYRVNTRW